MVACTLTDFVSMFACVQTAMPFAEMLTIAIFTIFFLAFKNWPLREGLPTSLLLASIAAGVFYGMGLVSGAWPIACFVLTALSVVFLQSQS